MHEITSDHLIEESGKLYAFALQRVGNHHHAEDLVQECLLTAWRKRDSFDGRSALSTWLFGIMKFKVLDHHRAAKRTPTENPTTGSPHHLETSDPLDSLFTAGGVWKVDPNYGLDALGDSPDENAERADVLEWVRRCVERLPDRLRLLFTLRDVHELPVPEAASAAGVTPGSAAVLLTRARHQVRACLQRNNITP